VYLLVARRSLRLISAPVLLGRVKSGALVPSAGISAATAGEVLPVPDSDLCRGRLDWTERD